jgi:hypothetical protein
MIKNVLFFLLGHISVALLLLASMLGKQTSVDLFSALTQ